jgi:hypothetical protein
MKTKLITPTIIVGIILSYLVLSYSNYLIRIDDLANIELSDSVGNSLFQISHVLLFTSVYLSNRIEKYNKFLLIPIIVQLVDLVPIEVLHSLKFSLVSTLSIIIGWITILIFAIKNSQNRTVAFIVVGVVCLIVSSTPGITSLTSLSNPNGGVFQFGVMVFGLDNFNLMGEAVSFHQSFSVTLYTIVSVLLTIGISRKIKPI